MKLLKVEFGKPIFKAEEYAFYTLSTLVVFEAEGRTFHLPFSLSYPNYYKRQAEDKWDFDEIYDHSFSISEPSSVAPFLVSELSKRLDKVEREILEKEKGIALPTIIPSSIVVDVEESAELYSCTFELVDNTRIFNASLFLKDGEWMYLGLSSSDKSFKWTTHKDKFSLSFDETIKNQLASFLENHPKYRLKMLYKRKTSEAKNEQGT